MNRTKALFQIDPKNIFGESDLQKMIAKLRRRGPDAEGLYFHNGLGLGHRRLSVLDLSSAANQPMTSSNSRFVIAYNGEVYNYKELGKKWNIQTKTTSDTEVILEAFSRFGPQSVNEFNGMFAFAIYDLQEDTLYIFRDRFGIKPLFYSFNSKGLLFASETKALLEVIEDKSINKEALKDYFFLEYIPSHLSIFNAVNKLEAGHYIKITKDHFSVHKYYDLIDSLTPKNGRSEKELIDQLEDYLTKSISYQTISDVPLGAFLSGGTDSSLICALFQKHNSAAINTFNIGFDVKTFDESKFAKEVADYLGTNHHVKMMSSKITLNEIESLANYYDEPFAVPSVIPSLEVCKTARAKVTVALSGDGADELFMGYGYYNWYKRVSAINKIGGSWGRKVLSELFNSIPKASTKKASRILNYKDDASMWQHVWSQEQLMFSAGEISALFKENYQHQSTIESWQSIDKLSISAFEKISLFDTKNYLQNDLLYKMDIASMSHGLEVRVPYLDNQLVEFALGVPVEFKIRNGVSKYLMKKLLERYLPKEIVYRKKWGFPAPVGHWLLSDLSSLIDVYLNESVLKKQGIFNHVLVSNYIYQFRNGRQDHFKRIWALLFFQIWYSTYIDEALKER